MIKVICIKDCSIFGNQNGYLDAKKWDCRINERYDAAEVEFGSTASYYNIYFNNNLLGMVSKKFFTTLAEYREQRIDEILDEE
jgi:hypothetical protein